MEWFVNWLLIILEAIPFIFGICALLWSAYLVGYAVYRIVSKIKYKMFTMLDAAILLIEIAFAAICCNIGLVWTQIIC